LWLDGGMADLKQKLIVNFNQGFWKLLISFIKVLVKSVTGR
jgi:hypothetical protein